MGTYVFKWARPASNVFVTGDFDGWSKSEELTNEHGTFSKKVTLPSTDTNIHYKFVVDGKWVIDPSMPSETDSAGNLNNYLKPSDIDRATSAAHSTAAGPFIGGVAPGSSTAQMAGQVPLEKSKGLAAQDDMPGAFPTTPGEPADFSVKPIAGSAGMKTPPLSPIFDFYPGDIVPDYSTYTSATFISGPHEDESLKKSAEQSFGVSPLPATAGTGNPIATNPGDPLPPTGSYTSNTIHSNVKTDKDSYEKSDAYPSTTSSGLATAAGAFGVPPVTSNMIPESSLPMGPGAGVMDKDVGPTIQSAGPGTSTAALAAQVPLEPRGVPEVVRDSQLEAHASPEASASQDAVLDKKDVEKELKDKVPEEPASAENSTARTTAAAGIAGGAAILGGAAAVAAGVPSTIQKAISDMTSGGASQSQAGAAPGVPETVKDAQEIAHASPEASANPEAVHEKAAMEKELTSKVPEVDGAGQPAPALSAATNSAAPQPQGTSSHVGGMVAAGGALATGAVGAGVASAKGGSKGAATGSESAQAIAARVFGAPASDVGAAGAGLGATDAGAKPAAPATQTSSSNVFANDPTIADSSTAPAIALATGTGKMESTSTPAAFKDDPVAPSQPAAAAAGTAAPAAATSTGLNAPASQPAQSAATAASSTPAAEKSTTSATKEARGRDDSRDISPMSRPAVTSGVATGNTEAVQSGWKAGSDPKAARQEAAKDSATSSQATKEAKKQNRRSFFGKIKDKLKN